MKKPWRLVTLLWGGLVCGLVWGSEFAASRTVAAEDAPLRVIVMDPLALQLSCPCVEGYAQRDYQALGEYLEQTLQRKVQVVFGETLAKALEETGGQVDLIIGKDSVVRADADGAKLPLTPIAELTDKQGVTTQQGLIVVRGDDPAQEVTDLVNYQIQFGPRECEEKHAAAIALLKKSGIPIPSGKLEIDPSCSEGATKVIEQGTQTPMAAVISSYAAPLLEGCGTIKRGDLRVVGKTDPVPFVRAFVPTATRDQADPVLQALLSVGVHPELPAKMETLFGFLKVSAPAERDAQADVKKKN